MNTIAQSQLQTLGEMQRMTQMIQADQLGAKNLSGLRGAEHSGVFSSFLKQQTEAVVARQKESSRLQQAFDMEEDGVSLAEVMIAQQKASVSFSAYAETRNKLLSAYQEIMSMQV